MSEWDWASSYEKWSNYEGDPDDVADKIAKEQEELSKQPPASPLHNHYHDHGEERKFFERTESEKMEYCERYRVLGNGLYDEGMLPKAAEHYQLALSYYEYCFPMSGEEQVRLDELRHACLCNISLCYYRLGELRDSVEAASRVRENMCCCLEGYSSVLLLSCSISTGALGSPGLFPSCSIITNNNIIAHNHHTHNGMTFYIYIYRCSERITNT